MKKQEFSIFFIVFCTIFISALMFLYLIYSQDGQEKLAKNHQQDFTFYPSTLSEELALNESHASSLQDKLAILAHQYQFTYEKRDFKVIHDHDLIYRIMSSQRTIDLPYYIEGDAPNGTHEIAIDYNFATTNKLQVDQYYSIQGVSYQITGFFVLPDQISPSVSIRGDSYNPLNQALILMPNISFHDFMADIRTIYVATFNEVFSDINLIKEEMLQSNNFSTLIFKEDNPQVLSVINAKVFMLTISLGASLSVLIGVAIITLIIAITQKINDQEATMGVLKALGYGSLTIAKRYCYFGIYVFIGSISGLLLAYLLAPTFTRLINNALLMPPVEAKLTLTTILLFIVPTTLLFTGLSLITSFIKLRKDPLRLIQRKDTKKANFAVMFVSKGKTRSFLKTLSITAVLGNFAFVFFILFAGFVGSAQLQMALSLQGLSTKMAHLNLAGKAYQSNVRLLTEQVDTLDESLQPYYTQSIRFGVQDNMINNGQLIALSGYSSFFQLIDTNDNKLLHQALDGVIINEWMHRKLNLDVGDTLIIQTVKGEYNLKVVGIEQAISGTNLYTNIDFATKNNIIDSNTINGFYSKEIIDFDGQEHLYVTQMTDIEKAILKQQETYFVLSFLLIIIGTLLAIITIHIVARIIIHANKKYIGMMKVFGYSDTDCNNKIFSLYRIIAFLGFIIGTIYARILMGIIFDAVAKSSDMYAPMIADSKVILISLIIFAISYEGLIFYHKRAIQKISLQEVMTT